MRRCLLLHLLMLMHFVAGCSSILQRSLVSIWFSVNYVWVLGDDAGALPSISEGYPRYCTSGYASELLRITEYRYLQRPLHDSNVGKRSHRPRIDDRR